MRVRGTCEKCGEPMGIICYPCRNKLQEEARIARATRCQVCRDRPCVHADKALLNRCMDLAEHMYDCADGKQIYDFVLLEKGAVPEVPEGWGLKTREIWGGERLVRGIWSVWELPPHWCAKEEGELLVEFATRADALEWADDAYKEMMS